MDHRHHVKIRFVSRVRARGSVAATASDAPSNLSTLPACPVQEFAR